MKRRMTLPSIANLAVRSSNGHSKAESLGGQRLRAYVGADNNELLWDEGVQPARNYEALGKRLAACGDLFRGPTHDGGLLRLFPDGKYSTIAKGPQLAPVIADRVPVCVIKDGKRKGGKIDRTHLYDMLGSEAFLGQFRPVDQITTVPLYLTDFTLTKPGYNDGEPGSRILYLGGEPQIADSLDTIKKFLAVMEFDTEADRTNALAAALTVMLRNHWPGGKPIICVTASKSHAGKDTIIAFATGVCRSVSISYQSTNWAFERNFVGALKHDPETAVVVVENARLEKRDHYIASAFLERFATDPEPFLFSTGTGGPVRRKNDVVLAISTNFGSVSEDSMNRSLTSHLRPVGNIVDRQSTIGNPKLEFLPANRERIAAELRLMVERWKAAGRPLDENARHPFSVWAKVIGGILKVNGFTDFLGNYGVRKTLDDPVRQGLGLMGAHQPDEWLRAVDWAKMAVDLGVAKRVIPESDRENDSARARGIGVILSTHDQETFAVPTDLGLVNLRLEKRRGRWNGSDPQVRYRFVKLDEQPLPQEADDAQ